jgi:TatD DNase family protein
MFIDTHSHLNFKDFEKDRFDLIEECLINNVWMINVGSTFSDSKTAIDIAKKYDSGVYATAGIHPLYVEDESLDGLEELCSRVIAIGEIGLDYFYSPRKLSEEEYIQKQKDFLIKQLDLAEKFDKPVILHIRKAFSDVYEIVKDRNLRGVVHCFTGNKKNLERFLDLGFYIGFNGIIFKMNLDKIIKEVPNDKILIETDCPFLSSPDFYEKRNNPLGVKDVLRKINEIKGEDLEEQVFKNSLKLFNI